MTGADSLWSSGETCQVVGKYYSRCCGGKTEGTFVAGDIFPVCGHCGKKLKWCRALTNVLPIDTVEPWIKGGVKRGKKPVSPSKKRR